jgi:pyruvate dehydrogenase (quinone)
VVYEAVTDPEVPPLPPHITIEQARALSSALLSGDPNSGRIVRESFKQKVQEFLPGR